MAAQPKAGTPAAAGPYFCPLPSAFLPSRGTSLAEYGSREEASALNWFNLSLVGWVVLIIALGIAAYLLGAPPVWIAVGALALIGIGIIMSVNSSKPGPPPHR